MEFFIIDSLHSIVNLKPVINQIKRSSPRAKITYTSGDKIQTRDFKNCGSFALDHAFNLAKITHLHESISQLAQKPNETNNIAKNFLKYVRNGTLATLAVGDFPVELGPLLRNMQSLSTLEAKFFNKGYQGSKKDSLEGYVEKHLKEIEVEGVVKKINSSIENKRDKLKTKAAMFFKDLDTEKRNEIIHNRKDNNFAVLTSKINERG